MGLGRARFDKFRRALCGLLSSSWAQFLIRNGDNVKLRPSFRTNLPPFIPTETFLERETHFVQLQPAILLNVQFTRNVTRKIIPIEIQERFCYEISIVCEQFLKNRRGQEVSLYVGRFFVVEIESMQICIIGSIQKKLYEV